jgi:hypothetical protein
MPRYIPQEKVQLGKPLSLDTKETQQLIRESKRQVKGQRTVQPKPAPQMAPDPLTRPSPRRNSGAIPIGTRVAVTDYAQRCCYLGLVTEGYQWTDKGRSGTKYLVRCDNGTVISGSEDEVYRISSQAVQVRSAPTMRNPKRQVPVEWNVSRKSR